MHYSSSADLQTSQDAPILYRVVYESGAVVRIGQEMDSQKVGVLEHNQEALVVGQIGRRMQVISPILGWVSSGTAEGVIILQPWRAVWSDAAHVLSKPISYTVVHPSGTVLRAGHDLASPKLQAIPVGQEVFVIKLAGRRAFVESPVRGWMSIETTQGVLIMQPSFVRKGSTSVSKEREMIEVDEVAHCNRATEVQEKMQREALEPRRRQLEVEEFEKRHALAAEEVAKRRQEVRKGEETTFKNEEEHLRAKPTVEEADQRKQKATLIDQAKNLWEEEEQRIMKRAVEGRKKMDDEERKQASYFKAKEDEERRKKEHAEAEERRKDETNKLASNPTAIDDRTILPAQASLNTDRGAVPVQPVASQGVSKFERPKSRELCGVCTKLNMEDLCSGGNDDKNTEVNLDGRNN